MGVRVDWKVLPGSAARGAAKRMLIISALLAGLMAAAAQEVEHLSVTQPGGMPGLPIVTGVESTAAGVKVTWDGPPGYYQLFQQLMLNGGEWQAVGRPLNLNRTETITAAHSNAFFKVQGPLPKYAGSQACMECHEGIHTTLMDTRHANAFETLRQAGQHQNASCLPCHTVGFGLPTGFQNERVTPALMGVQCESCHGPSANHAAKDSDPVFRPRVELASQVCGGCHAGSHQPNFDEWNTSGHARVVEDMNPASRINSCGRCHSGSARSALINDRPLPTGDANVGIVCSTCHNPHKNTANPRQLHNPIASMEDFFLSTSDNFAAKYNPNINACAQCHNHRGASWASSSRPPHHSPQYNMLLGTVGELRPGQSSVQARHATLEKQCVSCHMQSAPYASPAQPAVTGHRFRVDTFESCRQCHLLPDMLTSFTASAVSYRLQQVKQALDLWATTKSSAALRGYAAKAWEYTNAGELSGGGTGPTASEQALIPESIKKARFNAYLVLNDGSYGVHNGPHAISLLQSAEDWVREELSR